MAWIAGSPPPPGWYPDPSGQAGVRWWDGRAWTSTISPPGYGPGSPPGRAGRHRAGLDDRPRRRLDQAPDSDRPSFPFQATWFALAGLVVSLFLFSGVLEGIALLVFPSSSAAEILLGEVGLWFGLGGTCLLASRRYGSGSPVRDFGWQFRPVDIVYGLLGGALCVFAAGLASTVFQGTKLAGSNTSLITSQQGNTVGVAIVGFIAAVGAPVFEELFFRGLLRQCLTRRLGVGAVWVQALVFGLAHVQLGLGLGNVSVVVAIAGVGVVLGYTTYFTGRLGPDTVAHGVFNLFVTLTIIGVLR